MYTKYTVMPNSIRIRQLTIIDNHMAHSFTADIMLRFGKTYWVASCIHNNDQQLERR